MNHTKEPWRVEDETDVVAIVDQWPSVIADCFNHAAIERRDAGVNARRIVACVNACAGIPNEVLELDQPQFVAILRQRAELLAALEGVLPFLTGNYWPGVEADAVVDRAIAVARKVGAGRTATEGHNDSGERGRACATSARPKCSACYGD